MASKLSRLRDRLAAVLGKPDPLLQDVLETLERRVTVFLPMTEPERSQVAREAVRAIEAGWRPGDGMLGLRRALRSGVEFGQVEPDVAPELERLLADLAAEIRPGRWD